MKRMGVAFGVAVFFIMLAAARPASAFECPSHFRAADAAIKKAAAAIKDLSGQKKQQAHILLDDAEMWLASAKHNHAKPQNRLDHGRAIAKAVSAKGYAEAAIALAGS